MEIKKGDFVKVEYDMFANDKLVQTTNEKNGKEAGIKVKFFEPVTMIVGKNFILKAIDENILAGKSEDTLELEAKEAYGNRDKKAIRTMAKSSFDEHKMKAVVGMTYDFNGMYGTVKAVTGARIMVDFNNPLAGKKIKVTYRVAQKIEDVAEKLSFVLVSMLRLPTTVFDVKVDGKKVVVSLPKEIAAIADQLTKSFVDVVPEIKDYELSYSVKNIVLKKDTK